MINARYHLPLPLTVFKGKFQFFHRFISFFAPFDLICQPFMITVSKFFIPLFQFCSGKCLPKPFDHFGIKVRIRHLYVYFLQVMRIQIDPCIAKCLRTMHQYRFFHKFKFLINTLDLINTKLLILQKNPVCPAFYTKDQIIILCIFFQRNFRLVVASHLLLYLTVKPASFQHGFFIRSAASAHQITIS